MSVGFIRVFTLNRTSIRLAVSAYQSCVKPRDRQTYTLTDAHATRTSIAINHSSCIYVYSMRPNITVVQKSEIKTHKKTSRDKTTREAPRKSYIKEEIQQRGYRYLRDMSVSKRHQDEIYKRRYELSVRWQFAQ